MTTPSNLIFPHTIDSTMLSAFRSCPQKYFRTYLQHWKPQQQSVHLVAGGAFAKGCEIARQAYYQGEVPIYDQKTDPETGLITTVDTGEVKSCEPENSEFSVAEGLRALIVHYGDFECPPDSAKSLERMCGALEYYFEVWPLGADGCPPVQFANGRYAVEFSFAEPLPFNHPITGQPVLYTGRADMIGEFAGGIYTVDEKTTTSLGARWGKQWEMRSQFTGYNWAAKKAGIDVSGTLIRGIAVLKTKYNDAQEITSRSDYEIDRWLNQVVRDLTNIQRMWEENYFDYNLDNACNEYGSCSLTSVCKSSDPEAWLPMYFTQKVWDPLLHKEVSMEDYNAKLRAAEAEALAINSGGVTQE